jgi:adenylate kinase family enzyme
LSKIYIVGIVASGKTTFAKQLSKITGIPWYELDNIVHDDIKKERNKRTEEEQIAIISEIDKKGDWIIEGTYRKSCHVLFDLADKIFFIDPPIWKRRIRIFYRFIKQNLGIEKCNYIPNLEMLKSMYKWTNDFEKKRVEFEDMLKCYKDKLLIAKSTKQIRELFNEALDDRGVSWRR